MTDYFLLSLFSLLAIEIFITLKAIAFIRASFIIYTKLAKLITSNKISDHWKEKMVPYYAVLAIKENIKFLSVLVAIVVPYFFFTQLSNSFLEFSLSSVGIFIMLLFSALYLQIRKTVVSHYE